MNKKELINEITLEIEVSKKVVNLVVDKTFELISKTLINDKEILIPDFGKFVVLQKDSRNGINPKTGEKIIIQLVKQQNSNQLRNLKNY
ncbi:HU family DNA-binding protein [Mycoplasma mycoides]|uniref:HU family DNA-binding protein n=1 Tax=Mycoplasma mycoides TaxID=2102 RepID=UPI00223F5B66|nr:HU family DNA-binding protein [Mycoplasma mycoides]